MQYWDLDKCWIEKAMLSGPCCPMTVVVKVRVWLMNDCLIALLHLFHVLVFRERFGRSVLFPSWDAHSDAVWFVVGICWRLWGTSLLLRCEWDWISSVAHTMNDIRSYLCSEGWWFECLLGWLCVPVLTLMFDFSSDSRQKRKLRRSDCKQLVVSTVAVSFPHTVFTTCTMLLTTYCT
jgi:hypothetical protein